MLILDGPRGACLSVDRLLQPAAKTLGALHTLGLERGG
jgi:hypothetical protein